jgi:hypothetical protein
VTREPDFRELVGDDLPEEERARLERVHDLLVAAGPPAELPPGLAKPGAGPREESPIVLPRRRAGAMLALAAAIALVAFLGGFLAGHTGGEGFSKVRAIGMHGTGSAGSASATIELGKLDENGNWPLKLVARNLPRLPRNAYYEMFLTKNGKPLATCGTFVVGGRRATVRLNAPYNLRRYDGWIVTREVPGSRTHPVVLTT